MPSPRPHSRCWRSLEIRPSILSHFSSYWFKVRSKIAKAYETKYSYAALLISNSGRWAIRLALRSLSACQSNAEQKTTQQALKDKCLKGRYMRKLSCNEYLQTILTEITIEQTVQSPIPSRSKLERKFRPDHQISKIISSLTTGTSAFLSDCKLKIEASL